MTYQTICDLQCDFAVLHLKTEPVNAVGAFPIAFLLFSIVPYSLTRLQILDLFSLLSLQRTGLSFENITFSWLTYLMVCYGGTIIFFGRESIFNNKKGAPR